MVIFSTQIRVLILIFSVAVFTSCSFEDVRYLSKTRDLIPFEEVAIYGASDNIWNKKVHPFIGATPIDIDNNGTMEIFVGGGDGDADMLFTWKDGALHNIIDGTSLSDNEATHGANSLDFDNDGDTDLILTRNSGIFIFLNDKGVFKKRQIPLTLPANSTPFNVAVGDIDRDGDGDLYVSVFVDLENFLSATFNDPNHSKANILLRNDGDLKFTDITASSNTASLQNTFLSSFLDLDGDGWQDLIVAQNTGQVEIFRNLRNNTFSSIKLDTGWGFWMGLAIGDIDKDGDQDLFFTNSGNSIPPFLLEWIGDGTDEQPRNYAWILLRNDGDFRLSNVTDEYQLNDYGFAWGAVFEDLTLNGELELLVAQNYIKWTPHHLSKLSGKSFVLDKSAFYHTPKLGLENPAFAQSPLITDINNDGKLDVFWLNMQGAHRAFINRSENNFITLKFPDTLASIGVKAVVINGKTSSYTRQIHNNTGFSIDNATLLSFGLGNQKSVEKVVIKWSNGRQKVIKNPPINQVIKLTY